MYMKQMSDKYVQTILNEPPKRAPWHGFNDFTLKNGLEILLALLIPATIAILTIVLKS